MQRQIRAQLVELRERLGFAVLFITHDLSRLVEFSDRIAIMYGGRIVEEAPSVALYRDALHPYSDGLLHSFPALRGARRDLAGIPGPPPDLRAMPGGCAFHPRCPRAFEPCATRVPVLGVPIVGVPAESRSSIADVAVVPAQRSAELPPGRPRARTVACWLHDTRPV
jgi:peptide/nickel transport system ATP-binding protein